MSSAAPDKPHLISAAKPSQSRPIDQPPTAHNRGALNSFSPEPLPTTEPPPAFQYNASLHHLDTTSSQAHQAIAPNISSHLTSALRLQTEHLNERKTEKPSSLANVNTTDNPEETIFNAGLPVRSSSIRSVFSSRTRRSDSLTPASALSSPGVGPLVDMTPLPSPISASGSPGLERRSIDGELNDSMDLNMGDLPPLEVMNYTRTTPKKPTLLENAEKTRIHGVNAAAFAKNRSISEYVPEGMQVPKSRNIVVSSSAAPAVAQQALSPPDDSMHREQYLAIQRGLAISIPKPPTPPDSTSGKENEDLETTPSTKFHPFPGVPPVSYAAYAVSDAKPKKWRSLRQLGQGTFSTVMLATSEGADMSDGTIKTEDEVNPKSLVAVKICEKGPTGGADEKKIEISIKRELELMKSCHHPSLVQLKAVNMLERQALLVLNYCAGGDLFDLANTNLDILTTSLIRRMFAELVGAVRYLHLQYIVHRDIKLENILVNLPIAAFHTISSWQDYPYPVLTLTDLGLGRRIPQPPESPLLDTRCGSEDYAAPEVLMGQEYDGRATDAWALGVLLYALMEGRLPFDPVPGARRKSPTSHRIARCEWQWVRWADADGEWDGAKGGKLEGGREVVEGLIARTRARWSLERVSKTEWVARGIMVDGGLRRDEDGDGTV